MAQFLVNTTNLVLVESGTVSSMPDPFFIVDLEHMLRREIGGDKLIAIKDLWIDGMYLDKKKSKGYTWKELGVGPETVIGVLADMAGQNDRPLAPKHLIEEKPKKGGNRKKSARGIALPTTGNAMDAEVIFFLI